jgi:membrane protein
MALLAWRGFNEDRCPLRASALTFYTLLSIVPVAAMAFGIAKGFGFEKGLEGQVYGWLAGQEEVAERILTFARSFLETVEGGVIAGIGFAVLLWTVIKVLGNIESAFNEIWQVQTPRTFGRKFSDYLAIMLISPVLVVLSSSLTVVLTTRITEISQQFALLSWASPMIFVALKLIPYILIWLVLTILYVVMPNTRVRFGPALLAGIIAGTGYQVAQWGYITFQVGASRYNAVYGSFAALPLFLVWLQISWFIVLLGAEISFSAQNVDTYEYGPDSANASPEFRKLVALRIAHLVIRNFAKGGPPLSAEDISEQLKLPLRLARMVIGELLESGILTQTVPSESRQGEAYVPGRDTHQLTVYAVIQALERRGVNYIPMDEAGEHQGFVKVLESFRETLERSPTNLRIKDIHRIRPE